MSVKTTELFRAQILYKILSESDPERLNSNVKGVLKLLLLYFPTSNISTNFSWVSKKAANASDDLDSSISNSSIRWHYVDKTMTFGIEILLQPEAKIFEQAFNKDC